MIGTANIIKALTINIRNILNVKVNDRDIEEGFERPSFYIDVEEISDEQLTTEYYYDTYHLELYYFASDSKIGFKELLGVREKLRNMFSSRIETEQGFGITFDEVKHYINKADKVLHISFDVLAVQRIPDAGTEPMMEELDVTINKK